MGGAKVDMTMHEHSFWRTSRSGREEGAGDVLHGFSALVAGIVALTFVGAGTAVTLGPRAISVARSIPSPEREAGLRVTGGDPQSGRMAIMRNSCAACHAISGFAPPSHASAASSLVDFAGKDEIAGSLTNRPQNFVVWLNRPRRYSPAITDHDMKLGDRDAADIAAYLYRN